MQKIAKKLGYEGKTTLGMARHSFLNALKQEGVSINFIEESLGHTSAAVTEHYLNFFENASFTDHINKLNNALKASLTLRPNDL